MTIAPDQAAELLAGTTPGPWVKRRDRDGGQLPVVVSTPRGDRHHIMTAEPACSEERAQADTGLIAAAPDLAQTIAGMRWEYRVEEWSGEYWYPCETWTDDFSLYDGCTPRKTERLVRRLAGPAEVTE